MSIAASQSPTASSRSGAGAEGERRPVPVLIRIPDLYCAPAPAEAPVTAAEPAANWEAEPAPDTEAELSEIFASATPLPEKKPVAVKKPPFQSAIRRKPQQTGVSPLAILAGVALVACLLAALLMRKETPADTAEPETQDPPGLIASEEAPADEPPMPYNLDEPVSLRAEVPAPAEPEPAVMPWPRPPAAGGAAAQAPRMETAPAASGPSLAPPTNNSQIGTLHAPAFEARRPAATVEFEGTITKPEFRSHYERY